MTAGTAAQGKSGETKASPEAWWMLAVLFGLYTFSFIDRYVITIMVPEIKQSLGLSDFEMGIILGPAFAIVYSICGLPLGWVADRFPRRWVVFIGVAVFGLATAASGLAGSFVGLFLARMFIGIGEASLSPAAYSLMADKFPRNLFGTASAVYNTAAKVGTASALTLGGLAMGLAAGMELQVPGLGAMEPWRMVFLMVGVPVMLLSLLVFTFSEPPRTAIPKLADGEKAHNILSFLNAEKRVLAPMLLGFSLMAVCSFALASWAPTYIARRFEWGPAQYGPILGAVSLAAALTLVFKGAIVDWLYTRGGKDAYVRFYTWLLMGTAPIAVVTFFIPDPLLFMACYGVIQVVALPTIVFLSAAVQLIVPGHLRGQMTAVFLFCLTVVGGSTGPVLVASLTDFVFRDDAMVGYSMAIVLCSAIPLALALLRYSLRPLREAVLKVEARQEAEIVWSSDAAPATSGRH
ncbi:permease of the major facilitator superfamily [Phenylobacterium zucineum HLK1]|uniref:Permease of the major facilitator superfamily n=1 Tax=Phenylobacterium zucineum (strain HLK1) TaxID=450851 RepID=B4RH24_PHEZH|nr:MFS transporter [Phenylobacterium zucineum]ACG78972.1 permease of the major facilitator superfamily [Phenylobacterium zucineum HLK1]